jgi:hypothetical protein
MNRKRTTMVLSLTCLLGLGVFALSHQTVAVAQSSPDVSSGQGLPVTSSPLLPASNFCLLGPDGGCVSVPVKYAQANLLPAGALSINISGQVHFIDTGTTLIVTGIADGFDPTKVYAALIYDRNSVASGDAACLPTDNSLTFPAQMVVGVWLPVGSKRRTLHAVKMGTTGQITDYASLGSIGTVSIREETQLGQPLPARPDPARFQLRACGRPTRVSIIE